ncbi:class II aldolase/adducin family protein [Novosphingobium bradum]|uniref:Class II aldolase/adducin family protein n=1 Tax=Novosphingobium bradum TaxID=1737444 RepID=A0ABV7IKH5_9SPHN
MATLAAPADRSTMAPGEWELRVDLAAAYRLVALHGWDDLIFTHLSARVPGPEHHFLLNPYEMMFEEITASALVKVDMAGRPVHPTDHKVNPAGFVVHSAVHMARADSVAVMHLHTPHGQAVSAMKCGLLPNTQTAMMVVHDLAYHDYEGIALDLDERERMVADLGARNAMILRNHGTLALGATVGQCFQRMYYLERACQMQVLMLAGGRDNVLDPHQGVADKVAGQSNLAIMNMLAERLSWPALLRKLDRIDPSFRD